MGVDRLTLFVQDWGSLIGLRVVANAPERFARIIVANGQLPVLPEGFKPIELPETLQPNPDVTLPFDDPSSAGANWLEVLGKWAAYTLVGTRFHPAEVVDFSEHHRTGRQGTRRLWRAVSESDLHEWCPCLPVAHQYSER